MNVTQKWQKPLKVGKILLILLPDKQLRDLPLSKIYDLLKLHASN